MQTRETLEKMSKEELIDLLLKQAEQIQALLRLIKELDRKNARSAAPFSKNKNKANPKKPGRKKGKGAFTNRPAPPEEEMDEIIDVEVDMPQCDCGGELEDMEEELVSKTDIPPQPKAETKGYRIKTKRCKTCGKKYRGRHVDVAEDQHGATAHRMGERIMGMAHTLHYEDGIPQRKVPGVLLKLTGIKLTQGLLTQDAARRGSATGKVGQASQSIRESVRHSERVHTDDTGWRTGGTGAFLMGFETADSVFFQIRPQHRNEEVREVIPRDYQGVMSTDRGKSYDAKELLGVRQQKCLSHIQRNLKDLEEKKQGKSKWFAAELKQLFSQCIALWHRRREGQLTEADYVAQGKILAEQVTFHLRSRTLKDPANQSMLNELGTHNDRGNLLRFLEDSSIEPTNNRAERALRGAIIARKVSQCSKNERGANARTAFMSVIKTLRKRGQDVVTGLVYVMRTGALPAPESLNSS